MNARSIIERFLDAQRDRGTATALGILDCGLAELRDSRDLAGLVQISRVASAAAEHLGDPALAAQYLYAAPEPESAVWRYAVHRLLASAGRSEESDSL